MPQAVIRDGKVWLHRSEEERKKFVHALNRIEGQVRGVRSMIENDRYCGDELQQIKASIAALSRVARLLAEQHIIAAHIAGLKTKSKKDVSGDVALILRKVLEL